MSPSNIIALATRGLILIVGVVVISLLLRRWGLRVASRILASGGGASLCCRWWQWGFKLRDSALPSRS